MKKTIFTTLAFISMATFGLNSAFAAETLDKPENTNMIFSIDENINTDETAQKTVSGTKDSDSADKPEKNKKFFSKAKKNKTTQEETTSQEVTNVLVDSDTIEYFPERHEFDAIGNAKVTFPQEGSTLIADKIVFNHDTNFIKGYGKVILIKEGNKIFGDYIQVDLNDDNAMMNNPVLNHMTIKIKAKTGNVYDAKSEAFDGTVTFNDKTRYKFRSQSVFGFDEPMIDSAIEKNFYIKEKYDNRWSLKAKTIIIDSYKDRDITTLKNADIYLKETKIASSGKLKLYTDKDQQYIETNLMEVGSMRNIGAFISPGYVFQTPNASTLKIGPALSYDAKIGAGAVGRFMTDKNRTDFGYATSRSKIILRGTQKLTDDLRLDYAVNQYMDNWFMGGRMPKYGVQLVHQKDYNIEDLGITFANRFSGGVINDWDRTFSTPKLSWMTSTGKSIFTYKNEEGKFALDAGINVQTMANLYGTGDTMGVVRAGPYVRTQYKAWQQYIGYFMGAQAGDSPMNYDKNFYGKSSIMLGESLRINKYLTLMYAGTVVLAGDIPNNGSMLQENRFYFVVGPDDLKFLIGYDAYRQNTSFGVLMNVGAENSDVQFKKLILNDPHTIGQHDKKEQQRIAAKKKKEEERKKNLDPMNRSVKDYSDYNPGFNMMNNTLIQPSMIRPPGM